MKIKIYLFIALMCMTISMTAKTNKTVTLQLIETSDVHGAFFPVDFIEGRPLRGSLARVSSYVKLQRSKYGDNVILLENGDILQGQPTCYYTNYVETDKKNIAAEVVNYLNYDAQTFGNHDVETGHKVYDKWIRELNCPTLGANIIYLKSQKPYVEPYIMLEREGVRIAVLGMLTPAIPNWLHQRLWSGMRFEEMVSCARRWVKVLREKEQADIIVGLFHSGWEGGITTPEYEEDATRRVAEEVEGFDVLFFGHDHTVRNVTTRNGVVCLDPSCNAVNVAQCTLKVKVKNAGSNDGSRRVEVVEKRGEIVDITSQPVDDDFVSHFQPRIDVIKQYVGRKIGTFTHTVSSREAFFGSSAFTDLIHSMQLEETHADVSFNAPLQFNTQIHAGDLCMSDMFKLYRYENQIYVLRMTGQEIRNHLEMSYDLWVNTMQSPDDHIMLLNDEALNDKQRMGFRNMTFNFDSAAGIDYVVDVTKPDGQKVHILQFTDGRPFDEKAWYRVVMNSYRGNGGGELLTRGAGIPLDSIPSRIEYMSERDQRYYLTQIIERKGTVTAQPLNNWRFIPDAWVKPAIERDRKTIFGD